MAFIDWGGPFRQIRTHRRPISQFLTLLALLVIGDVALRLALQSRIGDFSLVLTGLLTPTALLGLGALTAAMVLWLRMLRSYQVSFFYPLWGLAPLGVFVVQWVMFNGAFTWKALFGAVLMLIGVGLVIRGGHSV